MGRGPLISAAGLVLAVASLPGLAAATVAKDPFEAMSVQRPAEPVVLLGFFAAT